MANLIDFNFTDKKKLDWISFAIQEAQNGNINELEHALKIVEELKEKAENTISIPI